MALSVAVPRLMLPPRVMATVPDAALSAAKMARFNSAAVVIADGKPSSALPPVASRVTTKLPMAADTPATVSVSVLAPLVTVSLDPLRLACAPAASTKPFRSIVSPIAKPETVFAKLAEPVTAVSRRSTVPVPASVMVPDPADAPEAISSVPD